MNFNFVTHLGFSNNSYQGGGFGENNGKFTRKLQAPLGKTFGLCGRVIFLFLVVTDSGYLLFLTLFFALECCRGYVEFVQKLKAPDVPEIQFVITFALDCYLNRTLKTNELLLLRWGEGLSRDFRSYHCSSEI